jgi:hypothetical protein
MQAVTIEGASIVDVAMSVLAAYDRIERLRGRTRR